MLNYYETLQDQSGNAISLDGVGTVIVTAFPGGGATPIYLTNSTASPIAASTVTADISGQVSFFVPDGAYILTYFLNGVQYKQKLPVQMLDPMSFVALPDSGSAANIYAITDTRLCLSLIVGEKVQMTALHTSTGASTFNLNGLGASPLTLRGGGALVANSIIVGGIYNLQWDGTEWQLS